ncbi:MAG: N-acetylglucosamine-6-phosphate deacetylase [Planctomyces sp.]
MNQRLSLEARLLSSGECVRLDVSGTRIRSILPLSEPADSEELPWAAPGLFDLQVNGYAGIWFSSTDLTVDHVQQVLQHYARQGLTGCLPTLITNSAAAIEHGLSVLRQSRASCELCRMMIAGIHVEGPWISSADGPRGAHPLQHVRAASLAEYQSWQRASGGLVRLITVAPECPEVLSLIPQLTAEGVRVAIGHTGASPAQIEEAVTRGASLGTHLGNGCAGMVPRHDNIFWPQLADDRLTVSVIADGWHVPTAMLNCIHRCKSPARIVLTSDVSGFGGCAAGRYTTPAVDVEVLEDGRIVVAGQRQFLAGSGATTLQCVQRYRQLTGLPLTQTWELASNQPRRLLGLPIAEISEGATASLTLFRTGRNENSGHLQPVAAVIQGHFVGCQ